MIGLQITVLMEGNQGRTSRQEPEAEAMNECCLLSGFPWLAQIAFLYCQACLPRDGIAHGDLI